MLANAAAQLKLALALDQQTARLEARMLLCHLLQVDHAWIIMHANQTLDTLLADGKLPSNALRDIESLQSAQLNPLHSGLGGNIHAVFEALLERRLQGEPMAYILGHREFYGLDLQVTSATLIPRADTETLVDAALEKMPTRMPTKVLTKMPSKVPTNKQYSVLDLGTGSGAIALAIAKHRPYSTVTAVDASPEALQIALANAQQLAIHNVEFVLSDWFSGLVQANTAGVNTTMTDTTGTDTREPNKVPRKFDLIVSNPPYIAANDSHLSSGDLRFEPLSALAAGIDGLDDLRKIVQCAPRHLHAHGWLMLEHGYDQAAEVALLLAQAGFAQIQHKNDLGGIARVTLGCLDTN